MAATPGYASTPHLGFITIATGDTSHTAPTSVGTVWTAPAAGGRIESVGIVALVTTTAGMIRLWINNGGGTAAGNYTLIKEIPVTAIVPSASQPGWTQAVTFDGGLVLQSGYSLRATTHNSESFSVTAFGADLT